MLESEHQVVGQRWWDLRLGTIRAGLLNSNLHSDDRGSLLKHTFRFLGLGWGLTACQGSRSCRCCWSTAHTLSSKVLQAQQKGLARRTTVGARKTSMKFPGVEAGGGERLTFGGP